MADRPLTRRQQREQQRIARDLAEEAQVELAAREAASEFNRQVQRVVGAPPGPSPPPSSSSSDSASAVGPGSSSSSSSSSSADATMTTRKVKINGVEVEILATAHDAKDVVPEPTLKKEDRSKLKSDKWVQCKAMMEKGLERKYAEVSVSEADLSVLSNTYELVQQNKLLCDHLTEWDMTDVFTLVKGIDATTNEAETVDLLQEWPKITATEVEKSNEWYHTNTDKDVAPWVRQNLDISNKFILDSCETDMRAQLTDLLAKRTVAERGGPLTFYLLMQRLQVNSERAIKHLIACVKKMDVKDFDGENIIEVVAQINGAHQKLKMVSFGTATSAVPMSFNEDIMDVLQTSSTEQFNAAFDYRAQRATTKLMSSTIKANYSIESILDAATDLYNQMIQDGTWLGKDHKAKEVAFKAQMDVNQSSRNAKGPCFNCGGEHMMKDCQKPNNPEFQKQMKKKVHAEWRKNRAGRGGGRGGGTGSPNPGRGQGGRGSGDGTGGGSSDPKGKFCPPAPFENNRR